MLRSRVDWLCETIQGKKIENYSRKIENAEVTYLNIDVF